MPELETLEYKGQCRRNGTKLRLSVGEYIRIGTLLSTLVVGSVVGWVTLNLNVKALADDVEEVKTKEIKKIEKDKLQDENIIIIQTDVKYIKQDVGSIKIAQQANQKLLYKILGKLDQ
jgi:hypothetical protein